MIDYAETLILPWTDQAFIVLPNIHLSYYDPTEIVSFIQLLYNVHVNPKQQVARVKFCLSYKVLFTPVSLYMFSISFLEINKIVRTRNTPPPTKSRSQNVCGNAAQILKNDDAKRTSEVTVNQFLNDHDKSRN